MNSLDPWRVMRSSPPAERMIVPAPNWGHPFYGRGIPQGWAWGAAPAWEQGLERGTNVFVGSVAPSQRTGIVAEVAPVLAPATGGFTARIDLDEQQHLHASICIDGKCYESSVDLGPAIAAVMTKIAQAHTGLHATGPWTVPSSQAPVISGDYVICCVDAAVGAAGEALVGALIDRHISVACAGWLDDIGHAIGGTMRTLKPVISLTATGVATYFGGPAAGQVAGALAGPLTDVGSDTLDPQHPKTPAQAQQVQASKQIVAKAKAQAKTDPVMAQALSAAQRAVAHTTVAYHVKDTIQKAAQGDPVAQQRSQQLAQAADQGDPAAQSAMNLAKQMLAQYEQNAVADIAKQAASAVSGWTHFGGNS